MYHYFNAIQNSRGDALTGYFVKAVDTSSALTATLYADENMTPIISVSGLADASLVDSDGNASFYIASGTYHLDIYGPNGTSFIRRVSNVPMVGDLLSGAITPIGAVGDGVTDDYVALQAWLDTGGSLWLPPTPTDRWYRSSQKLIARTLVNVDGVGLGIDPVDAPGPGYQYLPGSRIVFDKDVAGLDIQPESTVLIPNDYAGATQRGAFGSTFKNIALIGNGGLIGKGGGTLGDGVFCRTLTQMHNVQVKNFAKKGFWYSACTTGDGSAGSYGNLSNSVSVGCGSEDCGTEGLHVQGIDANTCLFSGFNAFGNGTIGIHDQALGLSLYEKPHCSGNPVAIKMIDNQANVIETPWVENGTLLIGNNCTIVGADATSIYDPTYNPTTVHGARVRSKLIEAWGQGVPMVVNSTNSNGPKVSLQDAGTIRGYYGASGSYAFSIYNSGVNLAAGVPLATTDWNVIGDYYRNGTKVIGARITGWAAATNTKSKATFDTTTVTLPNLAARVGQLIDDLMTHGVIGT